MIATGTIRPSCFVIKAASRILPALDSKNQKVLTVMVLFVKIIPSVCLNIVLFSNSVISKKIFVLISDNLYVTFIFYRTRDPDSLTTH